MTLDDKAHQLTGREELTYTNNSPATLSFIWFHLWPNAYRDTSTAFAKQQLRNGERKFQFAKAADRGYIDGLDFKVNGQAAKLEYDPENPDVAKLLLPQITPLVLAGLLYLGAGIGLAIIGVLLRSQEGTAVKEAPLRRVPATIKLHQRGFAGGARERVADLCEAAKLVRHGRLPAGSARDLPDLS